MTTGLLREAFERLEDLRRNALDVGHALHRAGAVAKDGKQQLAALARVVEPSAKGDGLAFVLAEGGDGGDGRSGSSAFQRVAAGAVSSGMVSGLSRAAMVSPDLLG